MEEVGENVDEIVVALEALDRVGQVLVELDYRDRQLHYAVEVGVTNAEIVKVEGISVARQLFHDLLCGVEIFENSTLGELERDSRVIDSVAINYLVEL